ncbi:AAA family ATPase [Kineococcus aurantiacus]|uniref:DNA-binding CsgD family transcriptional regulator n=1 Tax=Kineococcus aurantiacus TaxID=37633 RepID=A0A7Y9DHW9_9ACTN|nr:DNA-binding CsgD family transcriptional regulator [Kineococcus aurantiacus]
MPVLPPVAPGPPPALVGRAVELGALEAALAAARAGTSAGVLVEADAGVGKSRLVAELAAHARAAGDTVLLGHCASAGGEALPYLPFVEALEPLRDRGRSPSFWAVQAPGEPAADVSQVQLFDAVAAALAAAAREQPVLLVVEDLHWADGASRDLLTFLLRRLRGERLLVVATVRTDDLHRRHPLRPVLAELSRLPGVQRIVLDPFTTEETAQFLRELAGGDVPPATVRRIHARAEGNAYYCAELLLAGVGRGGRLPDGLADAVLTRLETLPGPVSDLVRTASVGGRRVPHDLLRTVTGLADEDLEHRIRDAIALRVLEPDGDEGYSFRHALLHEAVYGDLLPGERVRLHAAYADAIAAAIAAGGRASAAQLAHHARQSNDLPRALEAGIAAADEAQRLRAPAQAWRHLEAALPLWTAVPDAAERTGTTLLALTLRASQLASSAGEVARSALLAQEAVDLVPAGASPATAAEVHSQCASALWAADRDEEAIAHARRAQELGGDDPEAWSAVFWATAVAARCYLGLDRFAESAAEAHRALAMTGGREFAGGEADVLITLAGLDNLAGQLADADALFARAAAAAEAGGHLGTALRARYNLAADRYDRGDLAGAREVLDESCAWAAQLGLSWSPYGLQLLSLQATTSFVTGEFDRALEQARAVGPQAPHLAAVAVGVVAAEVLAARGAFEEVAAVLDPAWFDDAEEGLHAVAAHAEALRWEGRPAAAADALVGALFSYPGIEHPLHLLGIRLGAQAVGALADAGSADEALVRRVEDRVAGLLRDGQPRAGQLGPEGRAWAAVLRAEAARFRGAPPLDQVAAWRQVVEEFSYGDVYDLARARWRLAEASVAAGLREEGLLLLDQARRTAARLRAVPLAAALEDLARRVRARSEPGRGPLTARELQVLDLLAAGRTNRQVGEQLFMAEKTASVHVSRIFAKLGASSRAEAVSIGLRSGLLADRDHHDG